MQHVVRVSDGLGNQMFQYAFAYALKQKTHDTVLIDPLFWGTSLRTYQLNNYNISLNKCWVSPVLDYVLGFGPRNGRKFKDSFRHKMIEARYELVNEKEIMKFDPDVQKPRKDSFYMGFWQTSRYFDEYKDLLKKEFSRKTPLSKRALEYLNEVEQCNAVSIHVRRTDYVRDTGNVALDMSFYHEAIRYLRDRYSDLKFYVFSDDKDYIKEHFEGVDHVVIDDLNDLDEFEVMRQCRHHINANSTFSWWASYLSREDGMVIVPRVDIWNKDFYPEYWIKLNAKV